MPDAYLTLAKKVLLLHEKPMNAKEIISFARRTQMLPSHIHGKTINKTLQARISEDIVAHRFRSEFFRVSPGVFFLRSLKESDIVSNEYKKEFSALRREKSPRRQHILCLPMHRRKGRPYKFISYSEALELACSSDARYVRKDIADGSLDLDRLLVFTVVLVRGELLVHCIGGYSDHSLSRGNFTIGFRSYLSEFDVDLLNDDLAGVKRSACRELFRKIEFASERVSDVDLMALMSELGAVWTSDNYLVLFLIVDLTSLNDGLTVRRRSLGFNKPVWIPIDRLEYHKFDNVSSAASKLLRGA